MYVPQKGSVPLLRLLYPGSISFYIHTYNRVSRVLTTKSRTISLYISIHLSPLPTTGDQLRRPLKLRIVH